ncbi:MAG: 2-oxo acid dehydrogenase subunit E2 [Solirubrobacterales bacterium]
MAEQEQADEGAGTDKRTSARGGGRRTDLSKARLTLARRFAESRATIPHLELSESVGLSRLRAEGPDLVAAIVALLGRTLVEHPRLNAAWRDGGIEEYGRRNVAVVVTTPDGSAAATVFDADLKDPASVGEELAELSEAAAVGGLRAPQTAGATFTVHPPVGIHSLAAAVTGGQAASLAIGEPEGRAVPRRGESTMVEVTELSLSCDGRVVLPAEAGAFLSDLRGRIEGRGGSGL